MKLGYICPSIQHIPADHFPIYYLSSFGRSIHNIPIPGIDRHMGDIQKAPILLMGKEYEIPWREIIRAYSQPIVHAIFCLRRSCSREIDADLLVTPSGKVAAIGVIALAGLGLTVRIA